jgi:hypothetical protein
MLALLQLTVDIYRRQPAHVTDREALRFSTLPLHIEPFPSSAGTGTQADPYIISEAAQLAAVADYVNAGTGTYASAYYELANNIDLSRIPCWEVIGIGVNGTTGDHPFTEVLTVAVLRYRT